jgi:hypothetical protein
MWAPPSYLKAKQMVEMLGFLIALAHFQQSSACSTADAVLKAARQQDTGDS